MNEPNHPASLSVYQLRVVLRGISPLVWRRFLVAAVSTLADLHQTIQSSFGWSGESWHRFRVHGREYATHPRPWSARDNQAVRLCDLRLRVGERSVYEYGLGND